MAKNWHWKDVEKQKTNDIGRQFVKIYRACRQGSYGTRARYAQAMEKFIKIIIPEFNMQKITNMQSKHLEYYVQKCREIGNTDKTIKNDLAGIRFWHNQMNYRYRLTESREFNARVGLASTPDYTGKERAWTEPEYLAMMFRANFQMNQQFADMMRIARETGTRINEASTLRRNDIEQAIRTGILKLTNTKGGRPRNVPLAEKTVDWLKILIRNIPRGEYVFVPQGMPVHIFKTRLENWIITNRKSIEDADRGQGNRTHITYHGLRHLYARDIYEQLRAQGYSDMGAKMEVSERLGHGRVDVTKVYLGE